MTKSLIVPESSGFTEIELPEADIYNAVCYGLIDAGTLPKTFEGKTTKKRIIYLLFELTGVYREWQHDGKDYKVPHMVRQEFTLSLDVKAKLRKALIGWCGKDLTPDEIKKFDVFGLVGKPLRLNLVHKDGKDDKKYLNIDSFLKPVKGQDKKHERDSIMFTWADNDEGIKKGWAELGKKMQENITKSDEYIKRGKALGLVVKEKDGQASGSSSSASAADDDDEEDLPF